MTRRVFIKLTSATVLTIFAVGSFQFVNTKKRFHIFIKDLWPWLDIDPEAINQFINDYYQYQCNTRSCQIRLSLILMLGNTPILDKLSQKIKKIDLEKLKSQFLLSTDFFQEGMDESRTIKYMVYYDPYVNPCYSPRP